MQHKQREINTIGDGSHFVSMKLHSPEIENKAPELLFFITKVRCSTAKMKELQKSFNELSVNKKMDFFISE